MKQNGVRKTQKYTERVRGEKERVNILTLWLGYIGGRGVCVNCAYKGARAAVIVVAMRSSKAGSGLTMGGGDGAVDVLVVFTWPGVIPTVVPVGRNCAAAITSTTL